MLMEISKIQERILCLSSRCDEADGRGEGENTPRVQRRTLRGTYHHWRYSEGYHQEHRPERAGEPYSEQGQDLRLPVGRGGDHPREDASDAGRGDANFG